MVRKVDHDVRRDAFAAAAFKIIKKKGLANAHVRAVAKEAGFTTGALVHYINSKDELLMAAFAYERRLMLEHLDGREEKAKTRIEALRKVLYLVLPLSLDSRSTWNLELGLWERSQHNEAIRKVTDRTYTEWHGQLARIIKSAQEAREIPSSINAKKAAQSAAALVDGIAVETLIVGRSISARRQRELVDDWITYMLRPQSKHGAGQSR